MSNDKIAKEEIEKSERVIQDAYSKSINSWATNMLPTLAYDVIAKLVIDAAWLLEPKLVDIPTVMEPDPRDPEQVIPFDYVLVTTTVTAGLSSPMQVFDLMPSVIDAIEMTCRSHEVLQSTLRGGFHRQSSGTFSFELHFIRKVKV